MLRCLALFGLLHPFGCADESKSDSDSQAIEPIVVPDDPAEWGVPVGVQTINANGQTLEIWYPAVDSAGASASGAVDFTQFLPEAFVRHLGGDLELPSVPTQAVRDATVRRVETPIPVVVFSHGFGGMRVQSFGLTSHLASRGYVVVAPDHPGRMLTDVLPCLFTPALEGCDLSGFGADPAIEDLRAALAWVDEASESGAFSGLVDPDRMALMGHSAGAGSTGTLGNEESRFQALLQLAGGGAVTRDVPVMRVDGSCDGFIPSSGESGLDLMMDGSVVEILGAGHLAFTDLCALDLGTLADEIVAPRDDANATFLTQLRGLAVDGCPDEPPLVSADGCEQAFLDLDVSDEIVRFYATQFLDQQLKAASVDLSEPLFDETRIWTQE